MRSGRTRAIIRRAVRMGRVCCVALAACASVGASGPVRADEIKLATIAPDGSEWMREMRSGAERVRELTDGRVEIRFYPGGVMGNDAQVLRRIRIGQLHDGEVLGLATLARIHLRLVGNDLETAERQKAAFETARRMHVAVPLVPLILAFGGRVRLD